MSTADIPALLGPPQGVKYYRRNWRCACACGSGLKYKACCHPNAFDGAVRSLMTAVVAACREPLPMWGISCFPDPTTRTVNFWWTDRPNCEPVMVRVESHPGPKDYAAAAAAIRDEAVRQVDAVLKARGLRPAEAAPSELPTALVMGLVCASQSI